MKSLWNRRRFVSAGGKAWALLAASGWTAGCSGETALAARPAGASAGREDVLGRISFLLFPFPAVGPEPYARVAAAVEAAAAADAETASMLADGIAGLDAFGKRPWLELDESGQVDALAAIEGEPFFIYMLDTTRTQLFNDRDVWAHIGFDPAAPVNDIDWLGDD